MHDEHFYKFTKSRSISSVDREDEIGVETFLVKTQQTESPFLASLTLEVTTWIELVARPAGRYADAAAALAAAMTSSIGA